MIPLVLLLKTIHCEDECIEYSGPSSQQIEYTDTNCLVLLECSFLSCPGILCETACEINIKGSLFLCAPSAEIKLSGPTYVNYSRNLIYSIETADFYAIDSTMTTG